MSDYTIGYDTAFALNNFNQPKIRSEIELVKDVVLFVLFAKPGQYPDLPFIGMDIQNMLYSFYDEIDEEEIKSRLINQCEVLGLYIKTGEIAIKKMMYKKKPSLLIHIEGEETFPESYMVEDTNNLNKYMIGITFDELDKMIYNINNERGES